MTDIVVTVGDLVPAVGLQTATWFIETAKRFGQGVAVDGLTVDEASRVEAVMIEIGRKRGLL